MKKSTEAWYDQGIRYSLYALPVLVPLIFSPVFYTVFSAPKLVVLHALTLLIMLFWGAKVFVERGFSCRRGWLNWLLLTYAIISVVNTIFSVTFYTSLYGAQGRFLGIFTVLNLLLLSLFVWNFLSKKEEVMTLLKVSVGTACVLALYGIAQFFGLFQEGFNWDQVAAERVFGTIGHGNHFGAYLGMNLLLGLFLMPAIKEKGYRWLLGAGLAAQVITIFLTASRGAMGATLAAGLIALIVLAYKKWNVVRDRVSRWLLPGFLTVSIVIAAIVVLGDDLRKVPVIDRTVTTITAFNEGVIPDRLSWWLSSIDMIKERPLLGFGLSTYRDVYNQFRRTDYQTLEAGNQQDYITPEAAHNEYLNIAATQGLIGLAAFLTIIVFAFWKMDKLLFAKEESPYFYPVMGVKAALIVYLLQVVISFGVIATLTMFYLLLGAGIALTEEQARTREFKVKGAARYILALFLLSGISAAAIGTNAIATAEIHYKEGLVKAQEGKLDAAIQEFEQMVASKPFDYAYYQAYGDFALKYAGLFGLSEEKKVQLAAIAALNYENALLTNNLHPSTYYNLGIAYLQLYAHTGSADSYQRAVYNLEQAVAASPNNPLYRYQAGRAFLTIETDDARRRAAEMFEAALKIRTPYADAQEALEQVRGVMETAPESATPSL